MAITDWADYLMTLSPNQSEIARVGGVHSGTVSRWLSSQSRPDATQVISVARGFRQSPAHALVVAGYLTLDEVEKPGSGHPALRLADFSPRELARQLAHRLDGSQVLKGLTRLEIAREVIGRFTALHIDGKENEMLQLVDSIEAQPRQSNEPSMGQMTTICLRALDIWATDPRTKRAVQHSDTEEWAYECKHAMWELDNAAGEVGAVAWGEDAIRSRGHRVTMMAAMSVVAGVLIAEFNQRGDSLDEVERRFFAIADEGTALL